MQALRRPVTTFTNLVERLEEIPVGPGAWVAGFLSIVAVRHLLEIRSSGYPMYYPSAFYAHYVLAYLAPLLALAMILALFAGVRIERVLRLMLLAWGLTLLPPLVDTLVARTHEARIGYMDLGETPWITVYIHFFDPRQSLRGTTPGIRVEALAACVLGVVYTLLRAPSRRLLRALGAVVAIYTTSLFFFTLPTLFVRTLRAVFPSLTLPSLYQMIGRLPRPNTFEVRADQSLLLYLVPLSLTLAGLAVRMAGRGRLSAVRNALLRSEGVGLAAIAAAGSFVGWRILDGVPRPADPVPFDYLALVAFPLGFLLASGALGLLVPDPGDAPEADRATGIVMMVGGGLLAASVSTDAFAFLAITLGAALLARTIRRVLPWAVLAPQLAAGLASAAAFLAGYSLLAGDLASVLLPTPIYGLAFLMGYVADLPRASRAWAEGTRWPQRSCLALTSWLALAVQFAVTRELPSPGLLVTAAILSGIVLFAARILPLRTAVSTALLAAAATTATLCADAGRVVSWRERALASPTYFILASERADAAGDIAAAAGNALEAVRRGPALAPAHHRLGYVRYKREDLPGAIEEFRTAVGLSPRNAVYAGNLASALFKNNQPTEALEVATRAMALDPDLPSSYFVRAQCLDAVGTREEADEAWREYLRRAAGFPDEAAYSNMARQRLLQGPAHPSDAKP